MDTNKFPAVHLSTVPVGTPTVVQGTRGKLGGIYENADLLSVVDAEKWTPTPALQYTYSRI